MFISVQNLEFSYQKLAPVLRGVSVSLERGKALGIVGPSGCGKSTLLRVISGILPNAPHHSSAGNVMIDGLTPDEYRKSGKLAFMFQEPTLMPNLSVKENIAFPLRIKGDDDDARVRDLIGQLGLTEFSTYLPKQLSGGMKTRVALARSFVTKPELLILDEPFAALDIAWKSDLYLDLEHLIKKYGTTTVFVTHDTQESLLLSDDLIVLGRFGKVIHRITNDTVNGVLSRVSDISAVVGSAEYRERFVAVQKWILDDGTRFITGESKIDLILNRIDQHSRTGKGPWDGFENDTIAIRDYSDVATVHHLLLRAFRRSSDVEFKRGLIWDIVHFREVSNEVRVEVRDFYIANIEYVSSKSLHYYGVSHDRLFETVRNSRISGSRDEYPQKKLFLYLCDLYQSSEADRVTAFMDKVVAGEIDGLDDPLTVETALLVKDRIAARNMCEETFTKK